MLRPPDFFLEKLPQYTIKSSCHEQKMSERKCLLRDIYDTLKAALSDSVATNAAKTSKDFGN